MLSCIFAPNMPISASHLLTYGAHANAETVATLIRHAFRVMESLPTGERPVPVCIWGLHGIGKTELVRGLAQELNAQLEYIAPAQFEEMGDLIGMPRIDDVVTRFAPPSWVPNQAGPGILLLDDVNRADDRILRGIMQLLQFYELVSWKLPEKWVIVLTANPDGGDYSVTPMDDALLNRMLHITMDFNAPVWAKWAEKAGVDERGINFVLTYPELVNGKRTTPRSLVQFFDQIRIFDDLNEALPLIKILGEACLDTETVQAFVSFIHLRLDRMPGPDQILDSPDFSQISGQLQRLINDGTVQRLDILSVTITRLNNFLLLHPEKLNELRLQNLTRFILLDFIPNDLRLSMAQELTATGHPGLMKLYAVPEIGQLLLKKM
jgi:hypothetical protein